MSVKDIGYKITRMSNDDFAIWLKSDEAIHNADELHNLLSRMTYVKNVSSFLAWYDDLKIDRTLDSQYNKCHVY